MLFLYIYRLIFCLCILPLLRLMAIFDAKVAQGFKLREKANGVWPWLNFQGHTKPIWIHASSMEFEYAKPIIRQLKIEFPQQKIMVTYFSPSAQKACENFPGVDFACPVPPDDPNRIDEFLEFHKPRALLLARTDTWPEMLYQCKKKQIPSLLFSSTFTSSSSRNRFGLRLFYRWIFRMISQIFVVSQEDKLAYERMGVSHIKVTGDTRYDQVIYRLNHPKKIKAEFLKSIDGAITFIGGSLWPEDEVHLIPAIKALLAEKINMRFILVPHEPTPAHLLAVTNAFKNYPLTYYSKMITPLLAGQILIIDEIGILAELYAQADITLIGGSFKRNVHSVMESLACGCVTLVGPYYHNNREAVEFRDQGVTLVTNSKALTQFLHDYSAQQSSVHQQIKGKIKQQVLSRCGATSHVIEFIHQIYGRSAKSK